MPPCQPTVIVVEPRPRWAPELKRQFLGENVRVRQCTRLADLHDPVDQSGALVVDFDAAAAEVLQLLGRHVGGRFPLRIIAIGSPRTAELEWTVRDLGSLDFQAVAPNGERLAQLCRRQWSLD